MRKLLVCLITLTLFSCQLNDNQQKITNDETFEVSGDDQEMNNAIKQSKETFAAFITAFNNKGDKDEAHAIKVRYDTPEGGGEHIWIGNLFLKDGLFYGVVNNTPNVTKSVNYGDTVLVDTDNISDWMYISNGVLKGGYTLRVLRDQLSDQEKKEFDQSVGFIIEE